MDFLTINVSEFFRDAEQFQVLQARVIPDLLRKSIHSWRLPARLVWKKELGQDLTVGSAEAVSYQFTTEDMKATIFVGDPERAGGFDLAGLVPNILPSRLAVFPRHGQTTKHSSADQKARTKRLRG